MVSKRKKIFTFGEIMLRIFPADAGERIVQASDFTVSPGGSEANVAIALSLLGNQSGFITVLPDNVLSDKIIRFLKQYSVDTSHVVISGNRLGIYWTETGKGQRPSQILYDRAGSSFSNMSFSDFDWNMIFRESSWFHVSGITPSVSKKACETTRQVLSALPGNVLLSVDLNFRSRLWKWVKGSRAAAVHRVMRNVCADSHLITGNESDFFHALGIGTGNEDSYEDYNKVANKCFNMFPGLRYIGISLRKSESASENEWSGLLFANEKGKITAYRSPVFRITDIVDRVGTGDSFSAGLIHGLINHNKDLQYVVDFAAGLSSLNHSVRGDASQFSVNDVEHLLNNPGGRIIR